LLLLRRDLHLDPVMTQSECSLQAAAASSKLKLAHPE